ncbi:uncharacterized protein GIQ15_03858 [Arthroderma uncinatum]|uniref:uncharacterized protein n=1 Tax=Arthroderma uncinatum TaxID=74035 RepID=UPI00144AB86A|nr:uncharacterized protein GIQ15_03858 [Arthroderma uncinatum]KAF3481099.1 hypothetical protein GIQ15_03858 [Arthroderma uncinatum]
MPPTETLFLESTTRIQKDAIHSFMDFQIWDFPGQLEYLEPSFDQEELFSNLGALVWVIDAQDDYLEAVSRLNKTILMIQQYYPHINIEVFIHKVDGLSEEYRSDTFQDIVQRISDELSDAGYENAPIHYYLTSIYDYSVFEAFSKVIQKLIPQLSTLENLINILSNNSGMEKTYLFDVLSKIYIASDTRPVDMACYEMCSDYIDVIVDISELYSWDHPDRKPKGPQVSEAESHVILHDKCMIHLMEMNKYLCLVSVIKNPDAKEKKGLIDMNCRTFQDALNEGEGNIVGFDYKRYHHKLKRFKGENYPRAGQPQFDDTVYPGRRTAVVEELDTSDDEAEEVNEVKEEIVDDSSNRIGVVDILRFIFLVILISSGLSYYITSDSIIWGYKRPWFTRLPVLLRYINGPLVLSRSELSLYNGTDPTLPVYVSVNYTIYDVSANRRMYGPGGGYGFFAGRDATRAFVSGCFKEDLTSDLRGLEEMYLPIDDIPEEGLTNAAKKIRREKELREARANVQKQVAHWQNFFAESGKYFEVGKLIRDGQDEQGEKRELCAGAQGGRPKRSELKKGAAAKSEPTYPPGVKKGGRH